MEDLKHIIAKNISGLRIDSGITQLELAERLNYSDKAVSKWERGESIPDITVLKEIAELFDVSLDYLVEPGHDRKKAIQLNKKLRARNRAFITGMAILLVWLVATITYLFIDSLADTNIHWITFIYAVPVSIIVWLIFNSIWFNYKRTFLIVSILLWSVLAAIFISFLVFGKNFWLIFILGVPSQIIILLWSNIRYKHK
jgi:transcriptional regulator with XRE-family HTH domain